MYEIERRIIKTAIISRVILIVLQVIGNILIPDHDANVYLYPKTNETLSVIDNIFQALLGGFIRWDAQYFMHIMKYGYTYENTLAFFPLYPLFIKLLASPFLMFLSFLHEDTVYLLMAVAVNLVLFVLSALCLYQLSLMVLKSRDLAYKSSVLFCINPSSVFFIAPYTECLFSYLTFKSMLNCMLINAKHSKPWSLLNLKLVVYIIPICLSTCTRSNGLLNIGFIFYFIIRLLFKDLYGIPRDFIYKVVEIVKCILLLCTIIFICMFPFILVQIYDYKLFCTDYEHNLPRFLVDYAHVNDLVLPGMVSTYNQSWCFKKFPMAYSYVQDHYWEVGFLRYFQIKQLPNFLLAFPMILIVLYYSNKFFQQHTEYSINLGIFHLKINKFRNVITKKTNTYFDVQMFVFIVHAMFLTIFCFLCIHVQVTTRMLCSASPVPYWFCSYCFRNVKEKRSNELFLLNKNLNTVQKLIRYYFASYFVIGTLLFCNFLPWT